MKCKNCNTKLSTDSEFCNSCGAKVIRHRLTFKNIFEHITETFFNYDNKLLRTLIDLFKKPEIVIGGYVEGVRRRYVNPISYLALALTVGGIYIIVLNKFFPNAMTEMSAVSVEAQQETTIKIVNAIQEYYSITMVLLIPLYALLSRLVFINRKEFNYTEHVVMAMYIMAQFSLVSSFLNIALLVLSLPSSILGTASIFLQMAYFGYCYKRMYKLSVSGLILRTLFFFGIIIVIMIAIIILGFVMAMLFKDSAFIQQIIESQKATIEAQKAAMDSIPN
ncbi:DUF3667 domain-containing protein [Winogradskyella sp. UBA3174]|uniref:DUF3667 domain-containing protein n=1 Tax=Winogradskyella sp. UBA3174 TaxID=1947785 RepID=UPI0025E00185|nr:DUF3667 domain-containing protein [Winogradskyella sp. UBA3174]|tara:strand:+ start:9803 stop:10636 length:834 start_codon:yes stop_codon:yes gene_type:complete